jgi:hypothetical protein
MAAMKGLGLRAAALAFVACGAARGPIFGQDTFTLGFEGPASVTGSAGEKERRTFHTTLTHAGTGDSAQG